MSARFAPGPWEATQTPAGKAKIIDGSGFSIANTTSGPYDIQHANARLIAAAPDLLSLLIESQDNIGSDWRERRDAAIAKATGSD